MTNLLVLPVSPLPRGDDASETALALREHEKREPGRPVSLLRWSVRTRVALVGNPAGCPMLLGCHRHDLDRAEFAAELAVAEGHAAVREREEGMVLADAHVRARIE